MTNDTSDNKEVVQDPNVSERTRAGFRPGQGRPKGTTTIYSKESVKKLQNLGFDPIEMMVKKYYEVQETVTKMETGQVRYSAVALASLLSIQTNIMNTLMKYGYRAVPEKTEQVIEDKKPLKIVFTNE